MRYGDLIIVSSKVYEHQRTLLGKYERVLTDIAACSTHEQLCAAILRHGDVFAEVWDNG
jgi:hypothetical protein